MKRPATLKEAREIVKKARAEKSAGSVIAHRWHLGPVYFDRRQDCRASVWLDKGEDVAVASGPEKLTIIRTRFFETTVFVGHEVVRWINNPNDHFEDMHNIWASMLEYERVPRNGHLVWQALLAKP